ncbi:MAG: fused MFS/spermidine synthase [Acidobacteriota bacterium]
MSTVVFGLTLFLASLLLFLLEPMFGRMVLPLLGGAPAVWNTCLVFFQLTLLAGYLYAWASSRWLGRRAQVGLHGALLVAAAVMLPVRIVPAWAPPAEANPIPWLLAVLTVSIGLPFFVASTIAPMLQHWFAQTDHPDAEDPYFLYQASNLGSLVALLAYPLVVEPWLGLRQQGIVWSTGYAAFGMLVAACAWALLRAPVRRQAASRALDAAHASETAPKPKSRKHKLRREAAAARIPNPACHDEASRQRVWRSRESRIPALRLARWVLLAAVPSSLLLGVTTYLSTDVAAVPLLWVIPLALYLLTFIVTFARRPVIAPSTTAVVLPFLVLPLVVVVILRTAEPPWLVLPLHLAAFTAIGLLCHGQLASERPPTRWLTLFYLCLSVGGAAGGLFNALVAPLVFPMALEYPLALAVACLFKPYRNTPARLQRTSAGDIVWPIVLGAASVGLFTFVARGGPALARLEIPIAFGVPLLAGYVFSYRPIRFALTIAALLAAGLLRPDQFGTQVHVERSFFGVHRIVEDHANNIRILFHGQTLHGAQSLDPARAREPLAYYTRSGPAGQLFGSDSGRPVKSVAVVGLGAGAMAAFAEPGQRWTFYEIDPVVVRLARDSGQFTFLRNARGRVDVVVGDARLSLARTTQRFDTIVLDAFSSDAVPVHLVTREALELYLSRLEPGGVLAFHASSRFLALRRELAALAADAHLAHLRQIDLRQERVLEWTGWTPSDWVILARSREDFGRLARDSRWGPIADLPARVWTDDYSNIMALFRWR